MDTEPITSPAPEEQSTSPHQLPSQQLLGTIKLTSRDSDYEHYSWELFFTAESTLYISLDLQVLNII